nr:WAS/WASL-interacting protein family member 1-like [Lepeophtheirus salmonis]
MNVVSFMSARTSHFFILKCYLLKNNYNQEYYLNCSERKLKNKSISKHVKLYHNNNQNFLKDDRKLLISKKSEAPPPPPNSYKPPFPNRTRSFNTGSYSSNSKLSVGSRDDMLISKLSSIPSRRQMKPPNHPPPPPPIPKRVVGTIQNYKMDAETKQHEVTSQDDRLIKLETSIESFDLRFASMFKPSSLFPPPEPFTCIQKTYPSKNNQRKFVSRT